MSYRMTRAASAITSALLVLVLGATRDRAPTEARIEALEARIMLLESRATADHAAQAGGQPLTVRAPFTVLDDAGKPILAVRTEPRGMILVDAGGNTLVIASALPGNGFVKATNASQNRVAVLGADANTALLALRDGATTNRLTLEVEANGRPSLALNGDAHKPIVRMETQSATGGGLVTVSDAKGKGVVYASTITDGGIVKVVNPSDTRVAVMGIASGRATLSIRDGLESSADRVVVGLGADEKVEFHAFSRAHSRAFEVAADDSGGGRLNLFDNSGKNNVSMGALSFGGFFKAQTPDGGRVAILGTETGNALVTLRDGQKTSRATMVVGADGKGTLALFNNAHQDIVSLTESRTGAGIMQLFDANGTTMVEAGTTLNGKGTVRAGPENKCVPGNMGLSLPDCILGHKP